MSDLKNAKTDLKKALLKLIEENELNSFLAESSDESSTESPFQSPKRKKVSTSTPANKSCSAKKQKSPTKPKCSTQISATKSKSNTHTPAPKPKSCTQIPSTQSKNKKDLEKPDLTRRKTLSFDQEPTHALVYWVNEYKYSILSLSAVIKREDEVIVEDSVYKIRYDRGEYDGKIISLGNFKSK